MTIDVTRTETPLHSDPQRVADVETTSDCGGLPVPPIHTTTTSRAFPGRVLATTFLAAAAGCAHTQPAAAAEVACPIDRGPVTTNLLLRVLPLRIGRQSGTGFTIEVDQRQYLVTAKHILVGGLPPAIDIQLDEWSNVPVKLVGAGKDDQDVLVLAANRQLSRVLPVDEGSGGMMLGQPVRFLGYFRSVQTSPLPGYKHRGAPLVMSGIVSGFQFAGAGGSSSIWVDGHNNRGFSGGPVVYQPAQAPTRDDCRWKIAGVISGYVNAPLEVKSATGGPTAAVVFANAGLLRAVPMRIVRELIDLNPIGFSITP